METSVTRPGQPASWRQRLLAQPRERRLGLRLLYATVLASSCLALLATGLLLWADYQRDMRAIDVELARMERSLLPSLTNSLWTFDETQLRLQLEGLLQLQDVERVELVARGGERFAAGADPGHEALTRDYPLHHAADASGPLGTLRVSVALAGVHARLVQKAFLILAATTAGTLLVGLILFALVGRWVTRHLEHMARHARSLRLDQLGESLVLARRPGDRPDELDQVATALNDMTQALSEELASRDAINADRARAQEELRLYRDQLEVLVAQRTAELQRANDELVATNRRLEQAQTQLLQSEKMASIGVLAAGVAHEINNPLGFVSANLGTLGDYAGDLLKLVAGYEAAEGTLVAFAPQHMEAIRRSKDQIGLDELREDLGDLRRETEEGLARVKKIVQDLKDFSHAGESQWQVCDLHKGIDSTLNIAWNELKYKVEVSKQYGTLPEIECLPSELNQVFMNLFVNAAQAIQGRGQIRITTGADDTSV